MEVLVILLVMLLYWVVVGFRYLIERVEIVVWDCEDFKMFRKEWFMGYFGSIKSIILSSMI